MTCTALPPEVEAVFREFYTCEFTTLARDGTPITWPTLPSYWPARNLFVILTSPGLAQKAENARHNPRVALLFSDATGTALRNPPAVLVQGDADAPDCLLTDESTLDPELAAILDARVRSVLSRQPAMHRYMANPVSRYLMDWYFMRLMIVVTPRRITWWPGGDFAAEPGGWTAEASYVG